MGWVESIRSVFRSPATRRLLGFLFAAVVVFGAYLLTWVRERESYLTARNFRVLAGVGKQVESILVTEHQAFLAKTGLYKLDAENQKSQRKETRVTVHHPGEPSRTERYTVAFEPNASPPPAGPSPSTEKKTESNDEKPGICGELNDEVDRINPFLRREVFDYVAVAEANEIKFEQENREVRLSNLGAIRSEIVKAGKEPPWNEEQKIDPERLKATIRIRHVPISGSEYEVFLRPIRVQCRNEEGRAIGETKDLSVLGLVRSDRFLNEARALPGPQLTLLLALVIGAILGWPLLKLRSIAEWEPLSRFDLAWLASAMFLLPSLLTLAVCGGWCFYKLRARTDVDLKEFADGIQQNIGGEIEQYRKLLETFDAAATPYLPNLDAGDAKLLSSLVAAGLEKKPFFNLYWIQDDGRQIYKVNFGAPTTLLNLKERDYFRSLATDVRPGGRSVVLESIHSWTSGQPEVVVAMRRPKGPPEIPVVAIAAPLLSLIDPVLPPGFGFAVLQQREDFVGPERLELGEVVLHSDKSRNLRENFLQESNQPLWLRSALVARAQDTGTLVYEGRYRRAHTRPLWVQDQPWSLVVFAESDVAETVVLESMALTFILFALYALLVGLLFGGYSLSRGAQGWDWLWPQTRETRRRRPKDYVLLIWFFIALILICLWAFYSFGPVDSLFFVALLPVIVLCLLHAWLGSPADEPHWSRRIAFLTTVTAVIFIGFLLLWIRDRDREVTPWLLALALFAVFYLAFSKVREHAPFRSGTAMARSRKPYALCMALGMVLLTVLPTVAFFKIVFANEIELLVRSGQAHMARQIEERGRRLGRQLGGDVLDFRRLKATPGSVSYPPLDGVEAHARLERLVRKQLEIREGYDYARYFFRSKLLNRPDLCTVVSSRQDRSIRALLRAMRPLYGRWPVETGGFFAAPEPDQRLPEDAWRHCRVSQHRHRLIRYAPSVGLGPNLIETKLGPGDFFGTASGEQYLLLLALLISAGIAFFLIRSVVSRLFFETVRDDDSVRSLGKLHLVLCGSDLPELRQSPGVPGLLRFDVKEVAESLHKERSVEVSPDEDSIVVIDHFDAGGAKAAEARALLVRKTAGRRLVLIVSEGSNQLLASPPDELLMPPEGISGAARDPLDWAAMIPESLPEADLELFSDVRRIESWLLIQGATFRQVLDTLGEALQAVYDSEYRSLVRSEPSNRASEEVRKDRLVLQALANGHWVTILARRRLRHLARKGLVTLLPRPRIANRSLSAFLRRRSAEDQVRQPQEQSNWQKLRVPFGLGLTLVLMFLFVTQRDFFEYLVAMLGAVATGLTAVLQLFSQARGSGASGGNR
jgi:hypothetical protein